MLCGRSSVDVINRTPVVKQGYIKRFQRAKFGASAGSQTFAVIHQNSQLVWFKDQFGTRAEGSIWLKDVRDFITIGPYTRNIPGRPPIPTGWDERHIMAIPDRPSTRANIQWFLFENDAELKGWMDAICSTIPRGQQQQVQISRPTVPVTTVQTTYRRPQYASNPTVIVQDRSYGGTYHDRSAMMIGMETPYWGYGYGGGWGNSGWDRHDYGGTWNAGPTIINNEYDYHNTIIANNSTANTSVVHDITNINDTTNIVNTTDISDVNNQSTQIVYDDSTNYQVHQDYDRNSQTGITHDGGYGNSDSGYAGTVDFDSGNNHVSTDYQVHDGDNNDYIQGNYDGGYDNGANYGSGENYGGVDYDGGNNVGADYSGGDYGGGHDGGADYGGGDYGGGHDGGVHFGGGDYGGGHDGGADYGGGDYGGGNDGGADYGGGDFGGGNDGGADYGGGGDYGG